MAKVSEKSKKNLIPITQRSEEEQRAMRSKGGINSGISRNKEIRRQDALDYIWKEYGVKTVEEIMIGGTPAQRLDLLKAILPKDAQNQILSGSLDIQKIFVTPQEKEEAEKHIDDFING